MSVGPVRGGQRPDDSRSGHPDAATDEGLIETGTHEQVPARPRERSAEIPSASSAADSPFASNPPSRVPPSAAGSRRP